MISDTDKVDPVQQRENGLGPVPGFGRDTGFSQAIGAATLFPGVLYYVIVRGNQRQKIFADHFVATRACAAMV